MVVTRVMTYLNGRRRFLAYFIVILGCYVETSGRFGVTMAMMPGRMVKEDCEDPADTGELCWSKTNQALVLGSYFYGFTIQFVTVFLAKNFFGYQNFYRLYLIIGAITQLCYPIFAGISPILIIITQGLRGFVAGIMVAYIFRFAAKFSVKNENKVILAMYGGTVSLGQGTGGLIAEALYDQFGWRAYFYFTGAMYLVVLCLNLLFVHDNLDKFWYLTAAEKSTMKKVCKDTELQTNNGGTGVIQEASGGFQNGQMAAIKDQDTERVYTFRDTYCRVYLAAFCVYMMSYNLMYYNIYSIIPFFLNKILKADPHLISYLNISLSIIITISVFVLMTILKCLDKIFPWLKCRMICIFLPMSLQIVLYISLSLCTDFYQAIVVLTISAICISNLMAGSIGTVNYEIDPDYSPQIVSVYNAAGQIPGFVGPLLMTAFTSVGNGTNEDDIRQGWANYFYLVAGMAAVGNVAIVIALVVKPDEWVNRVKEQQSARRNVCQE